MIIVDAHEDLAWNALSFGRDYIQPVARTRAREIGTLVPEQVGQAMLGWPDWLEGNVGVVFATLYASVCRKQTGYRRTECFNTVEEAHRLYRAQLDFYHHWAAQHADKIYLITSRAQLEDGLARWAAAPPDKQRVGLVLLMEGAAGIRQPEELPEWYAGGVRLIGPAWAATQYAGAAGEPGPFTPAGRALLAQMARLGVILDLSHLAQEAVEEALADYPGPIVATHCNARALLPDNAPQRHLPDTTIRQVAVREGVIGIVLPIDFVKNGVKLTNDRRLVSLDDVADHIDHMAQLVGHTRHLGLGSDFDGGFGLEQSPAGFNSIADLGRIGGVLARRGYSPTDIDGILGGNWLNLLRRTLPE
jgi:membrane dipeptidase